jgi:hypothetical protein
MLTTITLDGGLADTLPFKAVINEMIPHRPDAKTVGSCGSSIRLPVG